MKESLHFYPFKPSKFKGQVLDIKETTHTITSYSKPVEPVRNYYYWNYSWKLLEMNRYVEKKLNTLESDQSGFGSLGHPTSKKKKYKEINNKLAGSHCILNY